MIEAWRPHSSRGYRPPAPREVQWPASPPAPATQANLTTAKRQDGAKESPFCPNAPALSL
nr:hypothetical protein DWF04_14335 [Cereibacter sphaeroides f. sp. denitrificans]